MKKSLNTYFLLGAFLFFLDRVTKYFALMRCLMRCTVNQFLSFGVILNRGVSWSMFYSTKTSAFVLVTFLVICLTLFVAWYAWDRWTKGFGILGETLVIAGSLSNVLDRFVYGGVVDFIELSYNGWMWPSFNLADVWIVVGVGIMFLQSFKRS